MLVQYCKIKHCSKRKNTNFEQFSFRRSYPKVVFSASSVPGLFINYTIQFMNSLGTEDVYADALQFACIVETAWYLSCLQTLTHVCQRDIDRNMHNLVWVSRSIFDRFQMSHGQIYDLFQSGLVWSVTILSFLITITIFLLCLVDYYF